MRLSLAGILKSIIILAVFLGLAPAAPCRAAYEDEISLRGAEQEETRFLDPFGNALSAVTYLPRKILEGVFFGAGHTAAALSDEDFVEKVKDILYFYDEKFLWFPIVSYASGFRPAYGGGLYYKERGWTALARATLHDSDYWSYSLKPTYVRAVGQWQWKNSLLAVAEKKDDRRYYGLGADPHDDPRNTFIGTNDYGVYTEERRKLQWSSALYTPPKTFGVTYLGYYQRRSFEDHGDGSNDVREVFDHSRIPGFDAPVKQLYNELAVEVDTRGNKKLLSPGFRSEVYTGISAGLGKHDAHLFRTGFDAAGFIPTVKEDRLIALRLVSDWVENINDEPIPFSEYPRQHTFRGVSEREGIRNEKVSLVPSIEYQWPLSHMFAAHVFYDMLFVGPDPGSIEWKEGLWAAGLGLDFHYFKRELGRVELAFGSEGFQAAFSIGAPLRSNHRKDW